MTTRTHLAVGALSISLIGAGCGHVKEFSPIRLAPFHARVPAQQKLIAEPIQEAVQMASKELGLEKLAGKTVRIEVNGVFPHTESELLDYIATNIETEVVRAGGKILPHPDPGLTPKNVIITAAGVAATASLLDLLEKPDVRLVASVDWGGIDMQDEKRLVPWRLGAQLGVGAGGTVIGILLALVAWPIAFTVIAPITAAIIWAVVDPPTQHIYTMMGRFHLTLRLIPNGEGIEPAMATGRAESQLIIDTESNTGFASTLALPDDDVRSGTGRIQ